MDCTLKEIRAASPCSDGWTKLLKHLGKDKADDTTVTLLTVLDSNGLDDALWVLDNVIQNRRIISLFSADCADSVLPIFEAERPDDSRPRDAIAVARDHNATEDDRAAARVAAWVAAWAAAGGASGDASGAAARAAARVAAWAAAGDASGAAARAAAWVAAWAAAGDAARAAQEARFRQYLTHGESAANRPWPEEAA